MWAPKYTELYSIPQEINYLQETESISEALKCDTLFANLNSKDYFCREANRTILPPFFDFVDTNSEGNVIVGANDLLNRENESSIIGYSKFEDIKNGAHKKIFEFRRECTITGMLFMRHNLIVITLENGSVELWSTRCDNNEKNVYCPFKLFGKYKHLTPISSLSFINKINSKITTGDLRGNVNVWDSGAADLDLVKAYKLYHSEVTGICANNQNDNLFFTCSNHGQSYITDIRTDKKGAVLLNDEDSNFTDIVTKDNLVFIGNFCGDIKVLDQRQTNQQIKTISAFESSVKKMKINGNKLVTLERGIQLKAFSIDNFQKVFEATENTMLRDLILTENSSCNVVGWNSFYKSYSFGLENGK